MPLPVQPLRRALALALAFTVAAGLALAADKKDEKKADDKKKPADPKQALDPKAAAKAASPATNTVSLVVSFPKATFSVALEAGKDPFFPTSKRRLPKAPEPPKPPKPPVVPVTNTAPQIIIASTNPPAAVVTNAPPVVPKVDLIGAANLSLRGISATKTRRLAEVHTGVKGYTFLKGDTVLIRLPNDKELKVQCLDIRDRSAVFRVEGETETKELFLREGIIF
jgi:hypothetical protein